MTADPDLLLALALIGWGFGIASFVVWRMAERQVLQLLRAYREANESWNRMYREANESWYQLVFRILSDRGRP